VAILRLQLRSMRAIRISIVALLLTATAVLAQQTHRQYEPESGPGAGQKLLAQFVGNWSVVNTFYPEQGKPRVSKGTCKQYMVKDGKFLESDFTFFDANGKKSTGTGISGFDPKTNRFTTVWFDSRRTEMSIRQSDGTFNGKDIVLWATSLDNDNPGRKTVARAHLEHDGHVLVYSHYLVSPDGKERMMFQMLMTRQ
jgi:hypothetical protein